MLRRPGAAPLNLFHLLSWMVDSRGNMRVSQGGAQTRGEATQRRALAGQKHEKEANMSRKQARTAWKQLPGCCRPTSGHVSVGRKRARLTNHNTSLHGPHVPVSGSKVDCWAERGRGKAQNRRVTSEYSLQKSIGSSRHVGDSCPAAAPLQLGLK